jgi:divalent metal cation (Fe/Co/Zn/Cd) transporter
MKTRLFKNDWLTGIGLLLTLPTVFFIGINILKDVFGISAFYEISEPTLLRWGIKKFGWNINLLIVFGPLAAVLLTVFQVMQIEWNSNRERFIFQFTIHKRWFPLIVAACSIALMAMLFFYLLAENCLQHIEHV